MPFYRCVACDDIRWIDNYDEYICNRCGGKRVLAEDVKHPRGHPRSNSLEPTILMRIGTRRSEEEEYAASCRYINTLTSRCECSGALVVGRYSVLPYYEDLEYDLACNDNRLINSLEQHKWIADFKYYDALREFTFESWTEDEFYRSDCDGPFVVKGATNSKKHHWNTMMFAKDRREAVQVGIKLREDALIGYQPLVYRKYTPLVTYEIGLNGLPFTNEHRLFFLGTNLIAGGYYWTEAEDVETPELTAEGIEFARSVASIVSKHANFFVLDIGEKQEGGWVLIEVNDGQQSGLSMIDPDVFYRNLAFELHHFDMDGD